MLTTILTMIFSLLRQIASPLLSPFLSSLWATRNTILLICLVLPLSPLYAAPNTLTIGISQFPATFHPNIDPMLAKTYVLGMTNRPFTVFNQDWKLTCLLCTELPSFDNGKAQLEQTTTGEQGIALTYSIQENATWGDDTPVTTQDVLFTWRLGSEPSSQFSNQELYRRILSIDVVDEKTFTLHMDRVTFDYAAINDFQLLPAHLEQPIFEQDPSQYRNRSLYGTDPTNPGLYFGPYRISKVKRGAYVVLERNATWWGKEPAFDKIIVKTIENTAALEANLLSGELDMIAGELGLTLDQALAFEQRHGDNYTLLYQPGLIYEHLDVRLDHPALSDVRVRQALLYGADRDAISQQLFQGKQVVANSSVNPLDAVYSDDIPHYAYDPKRAAQLLDEAGWNVIKKGQRYNAEGTKLSIEFMTTAGNRTRELVQQVLQSQWQQLGIDVSISNQPARVFFGETVDKRKFTGLTMYAFLSSPENVPISTLRSDQIPSEENGWSGQNYTGYQNPQMDQLIDKLEKELDPEKRKLLWHDLQRIYATDLPALPLYFRSNVYILPHWLQGINPTGNQNVSTLWIEQWQRKP